MISQPYYHGVTRKLIVAVGSLFSNFQIERRNNSNVVEQLIDVPVSYGNREKWVQRLAEEPTLDKRVHITLPRIGFEMTGLEYDPSRKLNKVNQLRACESTSVGSATTAFVPVPYNIHFAVYIMTKTQDDGLQIVEQILPFFSPQYTITINMFPSLGIVQDIPFTLDSVSFSDSYEGPVENRRELIYTLTFTAKVEFLGPINTNNTGVILHTRVKIDPLTGEVARQVNTDVVGTIEDYEIVDDFFDIARPIVTPYPPEVIDMINR